MTQSPLEGMLPVEQVDREAAVSLGDWPPEISKKIALGRLDYCDQVQAFARHRLTAEARTATIISQYAREAGEAKGRLEVSETAGIVEGWRAKCEALEARTRDAVRQAFKEGFESGVCERHDWPTETDEIVAWESSDAFRALSFKPGS